MSNTGTDVATLDTLAALLDAEHDAMLHKTAEHFLWDWRAAAEILRQTREIATANLHKFNPEFGPLKSWVWNNIRLRLAMDYAFANGYRSPGSEAHIEMLYDDPAEKAAVMAERAELLARIETLPAVLREPCRLWADDEEVPESLGWYVRQGLTLMGRRTLAA